MARFSKLYPFSTENLDYLNELDLTNKKVITITGSGDHLLNMVLNGCTKIVTFDINKKTKYYTKIKIFAIKHLSYEHFLNLFGLNQNKLSIINKVIFNTKYFSPKRIKKQNNYLNKNNYLLLKEKLKEVNITYIHSSFQDLKLNETFDYMFLSNISDYLETMYKDNYLKRYISDIKLWNKSVNCIYFAYVYDIDKKENRSDIDNVNLVKKYLINFKIKKIETALINVNKDAKDALYIIERND